MTPAMQTTFAVGRVCDGGFVVVDEEEKEHSLPWFRWKMRCRGTRFI